MLLCSLEHGTAGIASHTDGDIGLEVLEDAARHAHALEQAGNHLEIAQQVLAVKAAHRQTDNLIAGGRHFFHFHTALGSHKQDIGLGITTAHLVGDRQSGEDMTSSAATAHQHVELLLIISRHFWGEFLLGSRHPGPR